jgi:pSer/pThr/pTyr-binding forkhead associated (FHA) protein
MHLILTQIGADTPDEIEVTGSLFAVGRYEPPFSEYERSRVARLSKRHARIFEQDGGVFVADLGSTNGTFVNGRKVKGDPRPLADGDKLSFGGLDYRVRVTGHPSMPTAESAVRLALTPEANKEVLEPIVVSRFPFLINKHSDAFARYKDSLADQLSFISRRHAHFFVRDDAVYIEDLGSTNGTFVSGAKLEEHARRLEDGDTVSFGSDQFVYRVHILEAAAEGTTVLPETIEGAEIADRTIFIDSPTSFVDIYVGSQDLDAVEESDGAAAEQAAESGVESPSRVGRRLRFLRDLSRGLMGETTVPPAFRWVLLAVVIVLLCAGGWLYWSDLELRQINGMLARGEYLQAAGAADTYLARHPEAKEVRLRATEALLKYVVPEWIAHISVDAFDDADALLAQARTLGAHNPDDDEAIALLAWRTDASRFLSGRRSDGGLNQALKEERQLGDLVDWWDSSSRLHARELLSLTDLVPGFRPVREQIYSDVRHLHALRREQQPVREFRDTLDRALERKDMGAVREAIEEYADAGGDPASTEALSEDAVTMQAILERIDDGDRLAAYRMLSDAKFQTLPFADQAAAMIGRDVPDDETAARYREAGAAWRDGRTDESMAMLEALARKPWGDEATGLIDRQRALLEGYDALVSSRGQPDYVTHLFRYFSTLDREQDRHLIEALQPDLQQAEDRIVTALNGDLVDARQAWSRYEELGGIQPEQRLEDGVSDRYRQLATALTQASRAIEDADVKYGWLDRPPADDWRSLHGSVCQEVARQRRALSNLGVISADVQRQKLALVPSACEGF